MKKDAARMGDLGRSGPFGEIPKKLKEYYDSLQDEAIPDKFIDLLERLDQAEQAARGQSGMRDMTMAAKESS